MAIGKLQVCASALGSAAHVVFWTYQIGANAHPLGWYCGELSCWALIIAELPVSRLYQGTNFSVTIGSLLVGSLWWGILTAGCLNLVLPFGLASAPIRHRVVARYRAAPLRAVAGLAWVAASIAALVVTAQSILPWFGYA